MYFLCIRPQIKTCLSVFLSALAGMDINRPADYFITCYTVLTRPNKVETAVHGCKSWLSVFILSCRSPDKLSTQYQSCITVYQLVFLFLADQIFYRSYVNRQHFRLRSFASLCSLLRKSYTLVQRFSFVSCSYLIEARCICQNRVFFHVYYQPLNSDKKTHVY